MLLQKFGLLALGALAMGSPMPNGGMNVDDANTRSDWVTKYKPGSMNVDDTNTRSDWVTKYKPGSSPEHAELQHWIPLSPGYLKFDYSPTHHEHLFTLGSGTQLIQGDGLGGFMKSVARYLHV